MLNNKLPQLTKIGRCTARRRQVANKVLRHGAVLADQGKQEAFLANGDPAPAKGQPLRLIIHVPVNVRLAAGVKIQMDGKDSGLTGPFTRCVPAGCFAAIVLKGDIARAFRAAKAQVRIVYANAAGSGVAIPLSRKGFSQAFNALAKE